MRQANARWPVISFLELFCCALGGAAILLVLINREVRSSVKPTQMLRVKVVVRLPGRGKPALTLAPEGSDAGRGRLVIDGTGTTPPPPGMYGDGEIVDSETGKSLFFACDAAARPGTAYRLSLRQRGAGRPLTGSVAGDKELLTRLGRARAAAEAAELNRRQSALDRVVKALLDELGKGKPNLPDLGPRWYDAFRQGAPADPTPENYLDNLGRFPPPQSGPVRRYLALIHTLLDMLRGLPPARTDLLPYCRTRDQEAALRSDVLTYLGLWAGDEPTRRAWGLGPMPAEKFGRFWLRGELSPTDQPPAYVPIGSPDDVRRALDGFRGSEAEDVGLMWYDVAALLCLPRDLRIEIDWPGRKSAPIVLEGRRLSWHDEGGAIVYETTIVVDDDGPRTE